MSAPIKQNPAVHGGGFKPLYLSANRQCELAATVFERLQSLGIEYGKIQTVLTDTNVSRRFFKGEASIVVVELENGPVVFAAWKT